MSGWTKALLIIGLVFVGTVALNVAMWRRMKKALVERKGWSSSDCLDALTQAGCERHVSEVVLDLLKPYYHSGVVPQPHDAFVRFLAIDEEEVEDIVEQAWTALALPEPTRIAPERIPALATVGELAAYLSDRYRQLAARPVSENDR